MSRRSRLGVREEGRPESELKSGPTQRADLPDPTGDVWSESHLTAVPIRGEENGFFKCSHVSVTGHRLPREEANSQALLV